MKEKSDIKIKPRFVNRAGTPKVRTPVDYMGNEISIPSKENIKNEDRVKIVKQKHEDKYKSKTNVKTKTKNK